MASELSLPGALRLTPAFPFAGRARELSVLRALLPRAGGEGGRVALVSGEPGSGKSRLVRELAHVLAVEGVVVCYGACDAVVAPPYGPFVEALDRLVRAVAPDELRSDLGVGGGELVRILPDLPRVTGVPAPPPAADTDTERYRLHTAVADLLTAVGRRNPVLFVLEDLHWADLPALLLLRHLVRSAGNARMLLVVTCRDADGEMSAALSEALADLARAEGVVRLRLAGLSDEEVAEFVQLATGAEAGPDLAEAIGSLTEGNPFLLTELWRELVDGDALERRSTTVRLARPVADIGTPETVREVVRQRLARLDPATAHVLEVGAVVGSAFELDTVRRACGLAEAVLLDAVDEAERSGLVLETPGRGLAYRFAHELVRRAVADRQPAHRRAEIHLRVAQALESGHTHADARGLLAALAHHYAEAAGVGGVERAVSFNLLAAESAATALAFDEAVDRLRVALQLGLEDPRERSQVCLELGYACHRAGRATGAIAAFRETASLARALSDSELLARAAIGFEEACWRPAIHDEGAVELLQEAVAAVGSGWPGLRVRLLGGLSRGLDFKGDYANAAVARDEAIRMARERGDRAALAWVLSAAFWSRGVSTHEEIGAMLAEAAEIGEELDDIEIQAEALWWQVPSFVALRDHAQARVTLGRLFDLARRLNEPFRLHVAEQYASALAVCDGDLAAAEEAALRSHEWSGLLTGRDASGVHGIQMFTIRREQGRLAELAPVVRVLASETHGGAWAPGLAAVLAGLGMVEEARSVLEDIRAEGLEPLRQSLWLGGLTYLADAAAAVGDADTAAVAYPELEAYQGTNVQVGHLVSCYGSADRYLGMLAAVLGEWERAETHFEAALALNRSIGARTWLAHTYLEYGRMLLARGAAGDGARAATLLGDAAVMAEETGLPAVTARVAALGQAVDHAPQLPDGLTVREAEILGRVALGLSNREIGGELHISEHTAANHVRSILRKTGTANRTEAAAYAYRRGLVAP